jgi:hypothetical protein
VYCYGAPGCFPTESHRRSNYWVDVVRAEPPGAGDGLANEEPPRAPGSFTVTAASHTRIDLTWDTGSDNLGVAGYEVRRDGTVIASLGAAVTSLSDTGLSPSTVYAYEVTALDAAGNVSEPAAARATTLAADPPADEGGDLPVPPTANGTEDGITYTIGQHGDLLIDGKVFYPRCVYHVDQADFAQIAALGFNCTHASFNSGTTAVPQWAVNYVDAAQAAGVAVFPDYSPLIRNQEWSNLELLAADVSGAFPFPAHHAVDEPQYTPGVSPGLVADACEIVVAADPKGRACWVNHERNLAATVYAGTSDITGNDYYPVRYAGRVYDYDQIDSLARVYEYTVQTVDANPGAPVWFAVQSHLMPSFPQGRYPTPAEMRAMTYLALQGGATGLLWYAWADNYSAALGFEWDNASAAALRHAFPGLNAELAELMPVYTYGRRTMLNTGSEVIAVMLDLDSKQWVVAVNPTARTLSARLPSGSRSLAPLEVYIERP